MHRQTAPSPGKPARILGPAAVRLASRIALALCFATGTLSAADQSRNFNNYNLQESGWLRGWVIKGPQVPSEENLVDPAANAGSAERTSVHETNLNGVLDFNERFKIHGTGSPTVIATGSLEVGTQTDGWLLVRADGWLTVVVDGTTRLRRLTPLVRAKGWDAISLNLKPGVHSVRLECKRLNDRWALAARFIDNTGHAPPGASWRLPKTANSTPNALEAFNVSLELSGRAPFGLLAKISAPLGSAAAVGDHVAIKLKGADSPDVKQFNVGSLPQLVHSNSSLVVQIGLLSEWRTTLTKPDNKLDFEVSAGSYRVRRKLNLSLELLNAWQCLTQQLDAAAAAPRSELDVPTATLQLALGELSSAATQDKSPYEAHRVAAKVQSLCNSMENGHRPWTIPGIQDLGYRASADSSVQAFALHVPARVKSDSKSPLVVVLHGYNGTGSSVLDAFLDASPEKPLRPVDGFVLAPAAHGNTFYRGPGERDVLEMLDWALTTLPVDKNRVTITGVSMGGTGTAEIALHYPDRFAAHAPLCGYQSFYVRRDTSGQPIREWERKLMHRNSAASSAESGRLLPMYLAHGLKDRPLENSRVLTYRYKSLGYSLVEDWPNLGHAVWKKTWAHAGLFPWLSAQTRVDDPARITISTTSLRHAQSHWLIATELDSQAELSQIDVEIVSGDTLHVTSKGVTAFALGETQHVKVSQSLKLEIDGTLLTIAANSPLQFYRNEGTWRQGAPAPGKRKHRGAEGPWLDLWSEPLVFVYGTASPATLGVNLEIARSFAAPQGGNDTTYPVISDVEYDSAPNDGRTPVFVGSSSDHAFLKRWSAQLPLTTDEGAINFAGRQFKGDKLGAIYVYPRPNNPNQVIGVITAPTGQGLWQALSLPVLLPDFIVFDSRVTPAAGEPILGRRGRVLAAGFFNNDWSLPSRTNDPIDEGMP